MLFNSVEFLLFFPAAVLGFFLIPKKLKTVWLLAASYYFYMCWNVRHAVLIAVSTAVSWAGGLLMGKPADDGRRLGRKLVLAVCCMVNMGILFFYKYFDFALDNLNVLFQKAGMPLLDKPFDVLLPAGLSFFTFQAVGYLIDVYRGDTEPEKNILSYALFVSFFPQLVAGPIERSKNLLGQVRRIPEMGLRQLFDYERIAGGLILMLWGYFQKMVIADRIAVLSDTVFDSWYFYGAVELVVAVAAFSIQIYCDFASYSVIAQGAARVMGFSLMENFNTPYFSGSMREFWRRWHISLGSWFRDYLYSPLGGSRCGRLRRYLNTMIIFAASGLWHGAAWHYVAWGTLHGLFQVIGAQTEAFRKKLAEQAGMDRSSFSFRLGQIAVTYLLTLFTLVFFRAGSLSQAFGCIRKIFTEPDPWVLTDGTLYTLGLEMAQLHVLCAALAVLLSVSIIRYRKQETLDVFLGRQGIWFRWLVIAGLFSGIFLFGMYGPEYDASQFIYFQF